jgi:hypothetical protein
MSLVVLILARALPGLEVAVWINPCAVASSLAAATLCDTFFSRLAAFFTPGDT